MILAHLDLAWGDSPDTRLHRLVLDRTQQLAPARRLDPERSRGAARSRVAAWLAIPTPDGVGHADRFHRYERRPAP